MHYLWQLLACIESLPYEDKVVGRSDNMGYELWAMYKLQISSNADIC
jgi:hypothetical protein